MSTLAAQIIDALGGTTEVARLIESPVSTVHSWKRIGIPASRLAHLKLAATAAGKTIDWDHGRRLDHDVDDIATEDVAAAGNAEEVSATAQGVF